MDNHLDFLSFNGTTILFRKKSGEYWVALRPILKSLKLKENRYLKSTRKSHFFGTCLATVTLQVSKNGIKQGRKLTCLPERYIYSWICSLNSDNQKLVDYQKECSDLLFDHFNGSITGRKELLIKRSEKDKEISNLKKQLSQSDNDYKKLKTLEKQRQSLSKELKNIDDKVISQYQIKFPEK